jgi:hypothetical protein
VFDYYWMLRARYRLPVLPIGLYLRVGLEGLGWDTFEESFWERRLVHFEYPYVGLPALDAEHYLNSDNWLGVALTALMRVPDDRRAWLKAEALRRLVECPENDMRRFLLCEVVQAYLPLEGPQLDEFNHLLVTPKYGGAMKVQATWFEQGELKGLQRLLRRQLEKKFGPLSPEVVHRLESWSAERLEEAADKILDARSLEELGLGPDQPA